MPTTSPKSLDRTLLANVRAQVAHWIGATTEEGYPVHADEAMLGIERNLAQVLTSLYEGLVDAESERDAAIARAEKAEANLAEAKDRERWRRISLDDGW